MFGGGSWEGSLAPHSHPIKEDLKMDRKNENVELFRAFEVEELESRLQNSHYGYGDEYYGCSWNQG